MGRLLLLHIAVVFTIALGATHSQQQEGAIREKRIAEEGDLESWGVWGDWSQCTLNCGIGTRHQQRTCHQTRGETDNCIGTSKRYELCNIEDCPSGSIDFRSQQCENFNSIEYSKKKYNWIPFYGEANACELNCQAEGETFYYSFAKRVEDGTRCVPGSLDVCIGGECMMVGCDRVLGSTKKIDKCAVCDGDGSSCDTRAGMLYTDGFIVGYNELIRLPAGTTGLSILEEGSSSVFLALRSMDGEYFMSGDWNADNPGKYEFAGTVFSYDRIDDATYGPQSLTFVGPLTEDVVVMALAQKKSDLYPEFRFEYSVPKLTSSSPSEIKWQEGDWTSCSKSCAVGDRTRSMRCSEYKFGSPSEVAEDLCVSADRPVSQENCNVQACPASWHEGKWHDCSTSCGEGVQERNVYCQALQQGDINSIVEEDFCGAAPRPISLQPCNMDVACPDWVTSPWSTCNRMCGPGVQTRRVQCASGATQCDQTARPAARLDCNIRPCEGAEWIVSEWQGCAENCEGGVESRVTMCATRDGDQAAEGRCDAGLRPALQRPCPQGDDCTVAPKWYASQWSACSAKCGAGVQERKVVCTEKNNRGLTVVDDAKCKSELKMSSQQNCTGSRCTGMWFAAPYGKCSAPCGGGQKHREILCFSDNDVVATDQCDSNALPAEFNDCNQHACDDDDLLGGCENSPYGCCLDGSTPADGPNFLNCPPQDPVPVGNCIESAFGCCLDSVTMAEGPFREACPPYTCKSSEYGCCFDAETPQGADGGGCPDDPDDCTFSAFGCCPDALTLALGPNNEGCDNVVIRPKGIIDYVLCSESEYGCCSDGVTTAEGADGAGCAESGDTLAPESASGDASCEGSGCGSGAVALEMEQEEGEESSAVDAPCTSSAHGCCPDGESLALGADWLGCESEGSGSASASASGELIQVDCAESPYGCCPDSDRPATGPGFAGCDLAPVECDMTAYGCCPDGEVTAAGLNYEGCVEEGSYVYTCAESPYGCCPDRSSPAAGPNNAGCPSVVEKRAACGLASDRGNCTVYTVRWAFDVAHGSCNRFWYGGCEGNGNNYETEEACSANCVEPEGQLDLCYLPKSVGRCRAYVEKYYYDATTRQCERFNYGGCLGNINRFETKDECEQRCVATQIADTCSQPYLAGPCRGEYDRWFYDLADRRCHRFMYGGCKGNDNRFTTEEACEQRCNSPPTTVCRLPVAVGPCEAAYQKWYFEPESALCVEFEYGGCEGNANRFSSKEECKRTCHELLKTIVDICTLPKEPGPCTAYFERWYLDSSDGYCKQFVFGGCQGNGNQFDTEEQCRTRCKAKLPVDVCQMTKVIGPCRAWTTRYFYNADISRCQPFHYGGCDGNGNNFNSREECTKSCAMGDKIVPMERGRCQLPQEPGPCLTYLRRYFYNSERGACELFIYGGCGGNRNRFLSLPQCTTACESQQPATTPIEVCAQQKDSGECLAYNPMWYYERSINKCRQFVFGGCGGNENRFETQDACDRQCIQPRETPQAPTGLAVCALRRDGGTCGGSATKWYYDIEAGACRKFLYTGCEGNENRFRSRDECETMCPVADVCSLQSDMGPCLATKRRYFYNAAVSQCEEFVYGGCGGNANRFLSISRCQAACVSSQPEEVVQPTATTPEVELETCSKKRDSGPCRSYHLVWYYDKREERCAQFVYGGCAGNDNRFATEGKCNARCRGDEPAERVVVQTWPTTVATTTEAMVGGAEVCEERKDAGSCGGYVILWYYDQQRFRCHRFRYTGCGGNGNRFRTQADCERRCVQLVGATDLPREQPEPEVGGEEEEASTEGSTPATLPAQVTTSEYIIEDDVCDLTSEMGSCYEYVIKWYYDTSIGRCRRFYYGGCDGNGNRFDDVDQCNQVCVERRSQTQTTSQVTTVCKMPRNSGPCQAWSPRWYFDDASGSCARFQYGGCDGNENNFETEWECLKSCGRPEADREYEPKNRNVCAEDKDGGPCYADMLRYHFDVSIGRCRPFTYGGCQGNGNNFRTQEECYSVCTRQPSKYNDYVYKPADCFEASDKGNCNAAEPRWFFDSRQGDCVGFYYGGCNGNRNNFRSYDDCLSFCSRVSANCGVLTCDLDCSMGYARGLDGCLECRCLDPCQDFKCSPSTLCVVETVTCIKAPCPGPKAVCKPMEAPVIQETESKYKAGEGERVVITCRSRAAPAPQVTWYKNRQPLEPEMRAEGRPVQLADGSLEFREVRPQDAGLYTCRVYNTVGAATQTFTLEVQVAVRLEEGPAAVRVRSGDDAVLECAATGSPRPRIRWIRDGQLIVIDGTKLDQRADGSLAISGATTDDAGDYTCEAINGVGQSARRVITLEVRNELSISIDRHAVDYQVGDALQLVCRVFGDHGIVPTWSVDGGAVSPALVRADGAISRLYVSALAMSDTAEYTCTAQREDDIASASTNIKVEGDGLPEGCVDKPWYANCKLIVEADYCTHPYFSIFCCKSCYEAGKVVG